MASGRSESGKHVLVIPAELAVRSGLQPSEAPRSQSLRRRCLPGAAPALLPPGRELLQASALGTPLAFRYPRSYCVGCLNTTSRTPGDWKGSQGKPGGPASLSVRALQEVSRGSIRPPANKVGAGSRDGCGPPPCSPDLGHHLPRSLKTSVCSKGGMCAHRTTSSAASQNKS